METITENHNHNWTQYHNQLWRTQPKRYIYVIPPASMVQGTWQERGQKDGKTQNARDSAVKQSLLDMAA